MRTQALCLAIALVLLSGGIAQASGDGTGDARVAPFVGKWQRTMRAEDDAARAASIDSLAEELPMWWRALARATMKATMQPDEHYRIRAAAWGLEVLVDDDSTRELRVLDTSGSSRAKFVDGSIEQRWRFSESSYGTTTWRLVGSDRMAVDVLAFDTRLRGADDEPLPIRYTTHYSRDVLAQR